MFNRILYFLIFFTILLSFDGCNIFDDDNKDETIIRGKVIDKATSTPIDNVKLTISYAEFMGMTLWLDIGGYTNQEGTFNIEINCSDDYGYSLHCSKESYYNETRYIEKREDNYFLIEMIKDTTKTK